MPARTSERIVLWPFCFDLDDILLDDILSLNRLVLHDFDCQVKKAREKSVLGINRHSDGTRKVFKQDEILFGKERLTCSSL